MSICKTNWSNFSFSFLTSKTLKRLFNTPFLFLLILLLHQIEHHVWPDLSMLQYQKGAPKLKAICEEYGVPYTQENVLERLRKTVDIMVGRTTMREFPTEYEPLSDKVTDVLTGVTWKSTNGAIEE